MPGSAGEGDRDAAPGRRSPSERVERSGWGRLAISALVLLLLLVQVATHLPPSAISRAVSSPSNQAIRLLGAEQAWGVFAPDPRSSSLALEARITFADGSTTTWSIPQGARIGENLRFYRWRKWLERVRADSFSGLWRPTAEWLAAIHSGGPSPVTEVALVRYFRDNVVSGEQPPWEEYTYFRLEVAEGAGG